MYGTADTDEVSKVVALSLRLTRNCVAPEGASVPVCRLPPRWSHVSPNDQARPKAGNRVIAQHPDVADRTVD